MRRLLLWCLGIGVAVLAVAAGAVWLGWRSIEPPQPASGPLGPHRPGEFGFVGIRCGVDDPLDDESKTDYVDEVQGFTSLAHVCAFDDDVRPLLRDLPGRGLRGLLDVSPVLFEFVPGDAPSGSGERLRLRPDAAERWTGFVEANGSVLDHRHLAAYYLVDEPVWNGASPADIRTAAGLVDRHSRGVPLLIVEAYGALDHAVFPAEVDWIGFDRYGVTDPSSDAAYLADLQTVRRLAGPGQRLVLVLESQWHPIYRWLRIDQDSLSVIARNYQLMASRQADVAALIGYTWPAGIDPGQRGARDLPRDVRETYATIGRWVLDPDYHRR